MNLANLSPVEETEKPTVSLVKKVENRYLTKSNVYLEKFDKLNNSIYNIENILLLTILKVMITKWKFFSFFSNNINILILVLPKYKYHIISIEKIIKLKNLYYINNTFSKEEIKGFENIVFRDFDYIKEIKQFKELYKLFNDIFDPIISKTESLTTKDIANYLYKRNNIDLNNIIINPSTLGLKERKELFSKIKNQNYTEKFTEVEKNYKKSGIFEEVKTECVPVSWFSGNEKAFKNY